MTTATLDREEQQAETTGYKTELKLLALDFELIREQALATFDIQREVVAEQVAKAMSMSVVSAETYAAAKKEHWSWVKRRTALAAKKKTALADTRRIVAIVGEVADSFQSEFDRAELYLAGQIEAWDAAIAKAEKDKRDAIFNARDSQLRHAGVILERIVIESLTDDQIEQKISDGLEFAQLRKEQADREAAADLARQRLYAEEKDRNRVEAERLAADRAAFDRLKSEQQAELDRLREETQQLRKAEGARVAELERQRQAEYDRKLQVEQEKAKAVRDEADRLRAEQLKPIKEQLLAFADDVDKVLEFFPDVSSDLSEVRKEIGRVVAEAATEIRSIVAKAMR